MFLKLIKQDFLATYKVYGILCAVLMLFSILCRAFFNTEFFEATTFLILFYVVSLILFASYGSIYCLIQALQSIYKKRAYFIFSLPIKASKIIWSKLLFVIIYASLTSLICMLSFVIAFANFKTTGTSLDVDIVGWCSMFNSIISYVLFIMFLIFIVTITNASFSKSKRFGILVVVSVILFFTYVNAMNILKLPRVIYNMETKVVEVKVISKVFFDTNYIELINIINVIIQIGLIAAFYFGSIYAINKKLELQ